MNSPRKLASMLALSFVAASALAQTSVGRLAIPTSQHPNTIGTCDSGQAIDVEATAGTLGPTGYATLKLAFDAINAGTHQGAINIEICASTTEGTTPATLNSSGAGAAVYTAVSIRPLLDGLSISGNPATGFGVIQLKGADNVTIDGDNPNSAGTNRDLTIVNTNTNTAIAGSVIRIATVATATPSADNNTIRNLVLNGNVTGGNAAAITGTATSTNSSFVIYAGGNGGTTATDAPTALTSVSGAAAPAGTTINNLVISNNAMNQAARAVVFVGSSAASSTGLTVSNNVIGASGALVGAPPFAAPATTVYARAVFVIGATSVTITGNTIQNILAYINGTTINAIELNSLIGAGGVTISDNNINGVIANNPTGSNTINAIALTASTSNPTVRNNIINNVQTMAGATVAGLNLSQTGTGGLVELNRISTVYSRGSGGFAAYGINVAAGSAWTVQNNFVSDVNAFFNNGALTSQFGPFGIRVAAGINHRIYNNTVNLFGAALGGSAFTSSAAFVLTATTSTGVDVRNNIFANTITGAFAGSSVSAVFLPSGGTSAMNLTWNNNDYYAPATIIAQVGTTAVSAFTAAAFDPASTAGATNLRTYTSTLLAANTNNDNASIVSSPALVSDTDLHITVGSPAQNTGATIATVTNDIDQQLRPGGVGYDIGADEVDGVAPPTDDLRASTFIDPANGGVKLVNVAFSPQASFTNSGTNTQTNVTVRYRIVNASSVEVYNQTAVIPTLAFNATTTVTFPSATIATAGNYTIFARSELVGDVVPANDQISGSLVIAAPLAGAYTVGPAGNFTSFTNAGGLFQSINSLGVTANLTVTVTGDSTAETGANSLNQIAGGFTLSIQPMGARIISGSSAATALLDFNGADGVTIDGLNTGGNSLLIRNTATGTTPSIRYINDASNNTLRNTTVESGGTGTSVTIATGTVTGNDNIQIIGNVIRDRTDIAGVQFNGVGSTSASTTILNSNLLIADNDFINFNQAGVFIGVGSENVTISGNEIYQTAVRTTQVLGIAVNGMQGTNLITQNTIHDLSASGTVAVAGMLINDARGTTISRNRIYNLPGVTAATGALIGIQFNGASGTTANVTAVNNMISIVPTVTSAQSVIGLFDFSFGGNTFTADHNSIYIGGTASGAASSWALIRGNAAPTTYTARNNLAFNNRTGGTGSHYAGADQSANTGTFVSNYNFFAGTGATAANFMDYGTAAAGTPVSFAAWQAGPPTRDANSIGNLASTYVASDFFVDFANGDLHLKATALPVLDAGTPLPGVTIDIDGDIRSVATPDIGADEFVPNTAPTITPAAGINRQAGSAVTNSTIATVADAEQSAGSLVVTAPSVPAGLTVGSIVNTTGTVTADILATCSATLGANTVGLNVTDGTFNTTGNLTVTVTANSAPTLGTYPATSTTAGANITVTPGTAPADNGTVATLTAAAPGFTGSFSGNATTGVITVTNAGPASGTPYVVTVTATDNCGLTTTSTFNLTVSALNTAPTITPASGVTRQQGSAASVSTIATVSDAETGAGSLAVTAPTVPTGLTVSSITNTAGTVSSSLVAFCTATVGANTVVLNVSDGALNTNGNLTVTVTANSVPTLGTYGATSVVATGSTTVTPSAAPTDNGTIATLTASAPGFTGTFSGNTSTGVITVSNAGPSSGTPYVVTVTATDNCGATSTRTFNLTVTALPDPLFRNGFEDPVR